MLFNSAEFLIFFPLVVMAYFATPSRFRWLLLLAAGYYFYACWRVEYLALLIFSTVVDYVAGRLMASTAVPARRKMFLILSLCSNLGLLFFFKYYNFIGGSANYIADNWNLFWHLPELRVLLPVGISFYTFQSLSYTIDVYRGVMQPEKHLGIFAAFVSFFPQLVAGPIERAHSLLPQFHEEHHFSRVFLWEGLQLMLWGFVKKVAIADRLSLYVNPVYNDPGSHSPLAILVATYFFAFQIYCDFSGYSDIARGSAKIMGFDLMFNFRQPYLSQSIREFWQRWHISLSTWFRDYVYIPLGGNRNHALRNIFLTFLVSGLWHGANWTFVIWGALHGLYLVISTVTRDMRATLVEATGLNRTPRLLAALRTVTTFHLVLFGWIFFRANSIQDAITVLRKLTELPGLTAIGQPFASPADLMFVICAMGILAAASAFMRRPQMWQSSFLLRAATLSVLFWFVVTFGVFNNRQFIYFQF
ncbi:MAG: MBOAT family protein [Bryobacteraceae bacterium]|nr:MBOAT family protein [Bryobacteraceae bacterium]